MGAALPPYRGASNFRSLYIVTYGRSGSTLLQGYLNTLPGVNVKGENEMFPLELAAALKKLRTAEHHASRLREIPISPWYGAHRFSEARLRKSLVRAFMDQLYPARPIPKTVGFKEIRWLDTASKQRLAEDLEVIGEFLPPTGFIFLFRQLDDVLRSAWWAELNDSERTNARSELAAFEMQAQAFQSAHTANSIVVTYEAFTRDSLEAQRICDFLGVRFSASGLANTLRIQHSYIPASKT